jgi:CRISPR/Cas system-associated exonuclease Cas4 (RecB family)
MSGLTNKGKAQRIRQKKQEEVMDDLQREIAEAFQEDLDRFHGLNLRDDNDMELAFLRDQMDQITDDNLDGDWNDDLTTFSPSGASKCKRELAFKAYKADQDEVVFLPYQQRWVRNGKAVHMAFQKDLTYLEKQPFSRFKIERNDQGKFAWERNIRRVKTITHKGVTFQMYGMMDGILEYSPRNLRVGIDLKTKSTTIAAVGDYKMKAPQDNNLFQMIAYSILFDIDYFLIPYESLAKDNWTKGVEARSDMKTFCVKITDEQKEMLLDKYAEVAVDVSDGVVPHPDFSKCLFCPFKTFCAELEKEVEEDAN